MFEDNSLLLPIFYLPPISWFAFFFQEESSIALEQQESFVKQTHRNRTYIYGANGKLTLSIPIQKPGKKKLVDVKMSFAENWKSQHWKSIATAYKNSPYFDYYQDEIKKIYQFETQNLVDFSLHALKIILKLLKQNKDFRLTNEYQMNIEGKDARSFFSTKIPSELSMESYYQVFSDKGGFLEDLSILDLLCNKGPESVTYLKNINIHL